MVAIPGVCTASVLKAMCDCRSYDIVYFFKSNLCNIVPVYRLLDGILRSKKEGHHDLCLQFIWSVLPPNEVGRGIRLPRA